MSTTWNVRDADGLLVDNLTDFAETLGISQKRAAAALCADESLLDAAPKSLQTEAKAAFRPKPGGGTPPPIDTGSWVSWSGGKGKVDLLVTNGKVPGVEGDVEGTAKAPAARVVVYDGDGKSTGKKIGASTAKLKRIPPIKGGQSKSSPEALVHLGADHEESIEVKGLADYCRLTGFAIKAAYDRGLDAYPGPDATTLSPQEWAMGRAEHLVKAASLDVPRSEVGNDADLLAPEHPLHRPSAPAGTKPVDGPAAARERERDEHGQRDDEPGEKVEIDVKSLQADMARLTDMSEFD